MKYTIELDDSNSTGKNLLGLIEDLSKTNKSIKVISEKDDDKVLLERMNASLNSGLLSEPESEYLIKRIRNLCL